MKQKQLDNIKFSCFFFYFWPAPAWTPLFQLVLALSFECDQGTDVVLKPNLFHVIVFEEIS